MTILTSSVPTEMEPPTVEFTSNVVYRISFTSPFTGGSNVVILAYEIQIRSMIDMQFYVPSNCVSSPAIIQ